MIVREFDWREFRLLLGLLRLLGSRRELTSQFGFDAAALKILGGGGLLFGGLLSLFVLADPSNRAFLLVCLAATAFLVLPPIVSEAADALFNPVEVSVLAHRPIRAGSYLAAKITYVMRTALTIAVPFNLLPALAALSLDGNRWFYPVTHVIAVSMASLFTCLITCGLFGVVSRVLPIVKVRSAALWIQLAAVSVLPALPYLQNLVRVRVDLDAPYWSAIPLTWFAALGHAGQQGRPALQMTFALPVMILAGIGTWAGLSALTQGYMVRVSTMVRSRARPSARRRQGWAGPLTGWLAGGASGRGAAAFVARMAMRDWQFRREFLRGAAGLVIPMAIITVSRGATSPFAPGRFAPVHFLPHLLGLLLVTTCQFLAYTNHHRARWIFLTVPASGLRGVVRGTYWAIWGWLIGLPLAIVLVIGAGAWGPTDAALFVTYSTAAASLYLGAGLWLIGGLPFSKPPDPARSSAAFGVMFWFLLVAGVLAVLQRLVIFRNLWIVFLSTGLFAVAAWLAARGSFRLLEARILTAVSNEGSLRPRMFADPED